MNNKNTIPDGWKMVTMNDVCTKIGDIDHKMPKNIPAGIPYVSTKDFTANLKISFEKAKYISQEDYQNLSRKIKPEKGDVIFPRYGTIGKNILVDFDRNFLVSYSCAIIKPNHNLVTSKYLYLYSLSPKITDEIRKYVVETTQANIGISSIKKFVFPLPTLSEQQEIVAKIEELFSELDKGKEQLETARQQLKVYRQAVLNSAVIGEANHTIDSVIDSLDQGWSPKCHNEPSTNNDLWAVIKTTAVQHGHFVDNENKRLPENLVPREQHELKAGDLLITRAGPRIRVGVCCMVKQTRSKLLNCDKVYRMRINKKVAIPEFIELLLNSPKYIREIEKMKTGISDSGLNLTQKGFLKIMIPIPSIEEQTLTVQEIEGRLSVCDKVEETINQSLQQAETLRQSILKQAFEGKLAE